MFPSKLESKVDSRQGLLNHKNDLDVLNSKWITSSVACLVKQRGDKNKHRYTQSLKDPEI